MFTTLLKLARKFGPKVVVLVVTYGPQLKKIIQNNPQVIEALTSRFQKVANSKEKTGKKGLNERIDVLREQVTYLYASSDTPEMAQKAAAWRGELEQLQQAAGLIDALGTSKKISERRKLSQRLDQLSGKIIAATLTETVTDAEFDDPQE